MAIFEDTTTTTTSVRVLDSDGAQTDAVLVAVGANDRAVITRLTIAADGSTTGPTNVIVGFGTANVPTPTLAAVNGIVVDIMGLGAGEIFTESAPKLAIGAAGEDLRFTCEDPSGGNVTLSASYYLVRDEPTDAPGD